MMDDRVMLVLLFCYLVLLRTQPDINSYINAFIFPNRLCALGSKKVLCSGAEVLLSN